MTTDQTPPPGTLATLTPDEFARALEDAIGTQLTPDSTLIPASHNVKKSRGRWDAHPVEVWAKIEVGYRAGVPVSQLAEIHGVSTSTISARAKKRGWTKDLRQRVAEETARKVVADGLRDGATDEDIVDAASTAAALVTKRHQQTTARLGRVIELYSVALETALAPGTDEKTREDALGLLGPRETVADAILKTANALSRLLPQERIANGLNESPEAATPYEQAVLAFARKVQTAADSANSPPDDA